MKRLVRPLHRSVLALAALALLAPAGATTFTWKGGAIGAPNAWSVGLNWQGSAAPAGSSLTTLVFGGPLSISFNDIADGFVLNQVQAAGAATLGGKSLALAGAQAGIDVATGGSLTLNAALTGGTAWRKTGVGLLALGGSNTGLTGTLDIVAGRVDAGTATALGTGRVTVQSGAELRTTAGQFVGGLAGGGSWVASGATVLGATSAQTFAGTLTGIANLIVNGPARQGFSGQMNHVGNTSVEGGDLLLTGAAAQAVGGTALQVLGGGRAAAADGARWTLTGTTSLSSVLQGTASTLAVESGASFTTRRLVLADGGQGQARLALAGAGSSLAVAEDAVVGRNGSGVAQLDAGRASSLSLMVGDLAGASGVLDLGGGAQWLVGGGLVVGNGGNGQLGVAAGARLESLSAVLGSLPGGDGRLILDGVGSSWQNGGALVLGASGQGLLALGGAAQASMAALTAGAQLMGRGHLQLDGGAALTVQGALVLGLRGQAWLDLAGSAQLASGSVSLGEGSGALGVATLQSATWTVGDLLQLGGAGQAELNLRSGAIVNAGRLDVGSSGATAVLRAQGGALAVTGLTRVGGGGQLLLGSGGTFAAGGGADLGAFGGDGAAVIVGSGARFNATDVRVGVSSAASLDVQAGGLAHLDSLAVGVAAPGQLNLLGSSAALEVVGDVAIGGGGPGVLTLAEGGRLSSGAARIGGGLGAADALVTGRDASGTASRWAIGGDLRVGGASGGASQLGVTAGAQVSASGLLRVGSTGRVTLGGGELSVLGIDGASTGTLDWTGGTLRITGPGGVTLGTTRYLPRVLSLQGDQALEVNGELAVGSGTVVLSDQARLHAGTISLAGGQIAGGAALDLSGVVLRGHGVVTNPITGGAGGALVVDRGGLTVGSIDDLYNLSYGGDLRVLNYGRMLLLAPFMAYLGGNVLLDTRATLASVNGIVLNGGVLTAQGANRVEGAFLNRGRAGAAAGATLSFADSVFGGGSYFGDVRFAGSLSPQGSVLAEQVSFGLTSELFLSGYEQSRLLVSGTAKLSGGLVVDLYGQQAQAGQVYELMRWGQREGSFDSMVLVDSPAGLTGQFSYDDHGLRLTLLAGTGGTPPVPEPAPAVLLAAGLAVLGRLARRRMPVGSAGQATR